MTTFLSVGEAARRIREEYPGSTVLPKDITQQFTAGRLRDDVAPVVAGRRLIPAEYLPAVVFVLQSTGKLPRPKRRPPPVPEKPVDAARRVIEEGTWEDDGGSPAAGGMETIHA